MPGLSPQQTQDPPSQAHYVPVAPGTVANLRQTIGSGNTYRAAKAAAAPTTPGTPLLLNVTKFHVRVAHAYYSDTTPPKTQWAVFTDGWFVATNNNKPVTFDGLKETFRAQGQAQYIDFLDHITKPDGKGDWTLSTNHLDPKAPAPQLWCTWKGELCIQDAISLQDYPTYSTGTSNGNSKGKTQAIPTYPVTLLWYPRMPKEDSKRYRGSYAFAEESLLPGGTSPILSAAFDDLESLSELFTTADPPVTASVATTQPVANTAHKRQISEAIPRNERLNTPNEAPTAAPQQAQQAAQEGSAGTRKSGRAKKRK
jgi:hypothetical protein